MAVAEAERLRVLVVDDDAPARRAIASFIARRGDVVREAEDGNAALAVLGYEPMDLVLSDVRMPRMDGIELARAMRERNDDAVVVLMSAFASIDGVIAALREGAYDYLVKPIDPDQLTAALARVRERLSLRRRVRSLTEAIDARDALGGLVAAGPAMRAVLDAVRRASQADLPVLLQGESGTGHARLARAIHGLSPRSARPFVVLDTAAFAPNLLERELFGGVDEGNKPVVGRLAAAAGGTLLIDGLETLPELVQARLLRTLEDRVFDAPHSAEPVPLEARLLVAASEKVEESVQKGLVRPELYYRLRVIELRLPPLRERREDIPGLVEQILQREGRNRGVRFTIDADALARLMAHAWPGNVRELESVVQAAAAMAPADVVKSLHLPAAFRQGPPRTSSLAEQVAAYERAVLRQALESVHGQVGRAAHVLGVPERTLRRKMRAFGLAKEAFRKNARARSGGPLGA